MTTTTPFMGLTKPEGTDPVRQGDDAMRALADRVDYLLGESGDNNITPSAANTKTTKVIAFGRTYSTPPRVVVGFGRDGFANNITAGVATVWVDDVSTTDVTIGVNANNTTVREFTWIARPKRTDATP